MLSNLEARSIIFHFEAGENLRTGDYVKLRSDGKLYRAAPGEDYDFVSSKPWKKGEMAFMGGRL